LLAALPGNDLPDDVAADPRAFHRRLTEALRAWAAGELKGVEPYASFRDRCAAALSGVLRELGRGSNAALFGSAGSLAAAMQRLLGLGDWDLLRSKLTFYNSGVSSLLFDGETITMETMNTVGHLEQPAFKHLITHR
jgi:broad specificity phosphatase PhoE